MQKHKLLKHAQHDLQKTVVNEMLFDRRTSFFPVEKPPPKHPSVIDRRSVESINPFSIEEEQIRISSASDK